MQDDMELHILHIFEDSFSLDMVHLYSQTSLARTPMARLPWLIQT